MTKLERFLDSINLLALSDLSQTQMKNMTHSDVKVIWIADEKLFRVFDLGVAIHGSEFVCFLDTFIYY